MLVQKPFAGLFWLLLLAITTAAVTSTTSQPSSGEPADYRKRVIHKVNINDVIDGNIDAIQNILLEVDPVGLLDVKFPVTSSIFMNLHTGWLQNLSSIKRAGPCEVTYTNKLMTLDVTMGWEEITFDYRYLLKLLLINRQGDLHGALSKLQLNIVFEVDLDDYQVNLRRLDFADTGKVTIKLEGHMLDKIYNLVLKAVTRISKQLVLKTIQSKASIMVQSKIDEINEKIGKNHNRMFTFVNSVEQEPAPDANALVYYEY